MRQMHVGIFHWKVIADDRNGHRIYLDGRGGNNFSTEGDNFWWKSHSKLLQISNEEATEKSAVNWLECADL